MRLFAIGLCCAAALCVPRLEAQQCPAGLPDPLQLIDGQTWVFQTGAGDYLPPGMASIGSFKARFAPAGTSATNRIPLGFLTVNESVNGVGAGGGEFLSLGISRLSDISGRYQIYPDCSGGTLAFNLNQQAIQFEFVFANAFSEMYMTSGAIERIPGMTKTYTGVAKLSSAPSCPAGVDPLMVLDGTTWSFRSQAAAYTLAAGSAHVGIFRPTVNAGAGVLSVTESVSFSTLPTVTRLEAGGGRYQVYPDCSGGVLMMTGAQPVSYEFIFVGTGFDQMILLSDTLQSGLNTRDILIGSARKY